MAPGTSTLIDVSVLESSITGLKTGRCNRDLFDPSQLYSEILQNNLDLCRLKVTTDDEFAVTRLHQMGLPYFFSGSIRRYSTHFSDDTSIQFHHGDLGFEMYDGSQEALLRDMLADTWGSYPIGYYRTPYTSELVTKEQEIECVFQFYKKYNLNKDYPDNKMMFLKHGDKYVGLFSLNRVGKNLECNLGGILHPYRRDGYFWDVMNYNKQQCLEQGIEYFTLGARNENTAVQNLFQDLGFIPSGCDNVFHIPALLTYSKIPAVVKQVNSAYTTDARLSLELYTLIHAVSADVAPDNQISSIQLNNINALGAARSQEIKFSFPIVTESEVLMVIRGADAGAGLFTGYVRCLRSRA